MTETDRSRPLRIVMVVRLFHPWVGGTERQAHTLARALIDRGVEVRVVTGRWFRGTPRRDTIDGVPVFRNNTLWEFFGIRGLRKFGGYLYMVTLLWHLWRTRRGYDVIHVHGMNYHSATAVRAGRWFGRPTVTKLANSGAASDVVKMRENRQLFGARLLLPSALAGDRFVALNTAVVNELVAVGVAHERIISIPNGVPTESIPPRADHETSGPARVVFVGRLHEQKGLDILLEAAAKLDEPAAGRLRIDLLGEGPDRPVLEARIRELGLGETVTLAGEVDDVPSRLRTADVFVLPSRAEGLSNALLEAMAHGLPVIVSDVPGNTDVIEHDINGLRFDAGDPESLADGLGRLVGDEALRSRLGLEARRHVERVYSLASVVDRYIELYENMTSRSPTRV